MPYKFKGISHPFKGMTRRPISRDWFRIIADLDKAGTSNSDLARQLNVTRSAVLRWKMGGEPCYYYGERILQIHGTRCNQQLTAVAA